MDKPISSRGSRGVTVAVIDTGYRPHVDLAANIVGGYDFISDTFVSRDGNLRDNDARDPGDWNAAGECGAGTPASNSSWHGTHVSGTIAARTNNASGVAGVAFNARVLPVRVLDRCGGYTSDIAAYYSNFGSIVDVAAPGGAMNVSTGNGVLSTLNTGTTTPGNDAYAYYQGTSMATPHVAGVAALMLSVNPSLTPAQVETTLRNTTRAFPATCSQCGTGIVNARSAVVAAQNAAR